MKEVDAIIYRYLTEADFFNMYKPRGTEHGGGGQLYIDFPTLIIPVKKWQTFFSNVQGVTCREVHNGPEWEFPVRSIGRQDVQTIRTYQRRPASICIPNQNINTRSANRVAAWNPSAGFPAPQNPMDRHSLPDGLVVYFIKTRENEVWAGWFQNSPYTPSPCRDEIATLFLEDILKSDHQAGNVGYLRFQQGLLLNEEDAIAPFYSNISEQQTKIILSGIQKQKSKQQIIRIFNQRRQRSEDEIIDSLFGEDESYAGIVTPTIRRTIIQVRKRNIRAVRDLKELYRHRCQLTGDEFIFLKRDGTPYTEAHHLIPLANDGADNPLNIIIVSPFIHKMLHYAQVDGFDIANLRREDDGSASLQIRINNENYTIRWLPQHAERVLSHAQNQH